MLVCLPAFPGRLVTYTESILRLTENGLYCAAGDFYIDPWGPVARAVITHAHVDHARAGSGAYLTARDAAALVRMRVGEAPAIQTVDYGEAVNLGGVQVSLHPAGHILGSAQVRMEAGGEVWVVSGDYTPEPDATCTPYEPVRCDVFVTEATFGLPIYRWRPQSEVWTEIRNWWAANQRAAKRSVLFACSLGQAQRALAGLKGAQGEIYTHATVERYCRIYRDAGIQLPPTRPVEGALIGETGSGALVVAPPAANGAAWLRRWGPLATGMVSGWMRIRGARRRRSLDRGFVVSGHADWPGLMTAIRESGAARVWVTHGYRGPLAQWLQEQGLEAEAIETRFEGDQDETGAEAGEGET